MIDKKRLLAWACGLGMTMAAGGASAAFVSFASKSLTTTGSGLAGTGDWGTNFSIAYNVSLGNNDDAGKWKYEYTLDPGDGGGVSHTIFEVSDNFTSENVLTGSSGKYEIDTYSNEGQGNSNPNMPGPLFGIKFDFGAGDAKTVTYTLISDRGPRYGDFYAKDGKTGGQGGGEWNAIWNSGFAADDPNPIDPNNLADDHIITPDTSVVPLPAAAWLFGSALLGMASLGVGNRRRAA